MISQNELLYHDNRRSPQINTTSNHTFAGKISRLLRPVFYDFPGKKIPMNFLLRCEKSTYGFLIPPMSQAALNLDQGFLR